VLAALASYHTTINARGKHHYLASIVSQYAQSFWQCVEKTALIHGFTPMIRHCADLQLDAPPFLITSSELRA
jgi:hypothetical protein